MLRRTFDAAAVNALVNHPDVRPFIGGEGELDLSEAVERPEHLFIVGEHGGFALIWTAPGAYEVHTFILKGGRGQWARAAAAEGIAMARKQGAVQLWTKIPPEQGNVRAFAAMMGMQPTGRTVETFGHPYAVFSMEVH